MGDWASLSDLSSCCNEKSSGNEGGEESNQMVAAASSGAMSQPQPQQLAAGSPPGTASEVLRRRINHVQRMLNAFNSGGIDEFPNLIRELYHEVGQSVREPRCGWYLHFLLFMVLTAVGCGLLDGYRTVLF